jgi:hypothetical protein
MTIVYISLIDVRSRGGNIEDWNSIFYCNGSIRERKWVKAKPQDLEDIVGIKYEGILLKIFMFRMNT